MLDCRCVDQLVWSAFNCTIRPSGLSSHWPVDIPTVVLMRSLPDRSRHEAPKPILSFDPTSTSLDVVSSSTHTNLHSLFRLFTVARTNSHQIRIAFSAFSHSTPKPHLEWDTNGDIDTTKPSAGVGSFVHFVALRYDKPMALNLSFSFSLSFPSRSPNPNA